MYHCGRRSNGAARFVSNRIFKIPVNTGKSESIQSVMSFRSSIIKSRIKGTAAVLAGVCTLGILGGCGAVTEETPMVIVEEQDESISYRTATAQIGDVVCTRNVNCTYRQTRDQQVSFTLGGRVVDHVYVMKGDTVKKGDLLAELSAGNLEDRIAELEYRIARNELQAGYLPIQHEFDYRQAWGQFFYYTWQNSGDVENLHKNQDQLAKQYTERMEDYNDALEFDRKELAALKSELARSRVYAELDGTVYKLTENLEGSTSRKDEVVMTIVDDSECIFEAEMPELADLFPEDVPVEMTVVYGSGAGTYSLIPYERDTWEEKLLFTVLEAPENAQLEVGTAGTIHVQTDKRENVLCVPKETVHQADDRTYVYVLNDEGMREVRNVTIGLIGDTMTEIKEGLSDGEKVVKR